MKNQQTIARNIISALDNSGLFHSVKLISSVANGSFVALSDIDILVSNTARTPKENVELASRIIESHVGVLIKGWSLSLLPNKYLLHHFLPNTSLFWWIDISCLPASTDQPLHRNDIDECPNTHIATLWVMNAKHMLRGNTQRLKIKALHQKVFDQNTMQLTDISAFISVYQSIDFSKLPQHFHEQCQAILEQLLNSSNTSLLSTMNT